MVKITELFSFIGYKFRTYKLLSPHLEAVSLKIVFLQLNIWKFLRNWFAVNDKNNMPAQIGIYCVHVSTEV